MRTRTFVGLIILILALLVAATPELLQPTAHGVERAGIAAGMLEDPSKRWARETRSADEDGPIDPRLELKGFVVEENGDLRDLKLPGDRAAAMTRLADGNRRILLPGQQAVDSTLPPVNSPEGVRLDSTGCPMFSATTDIAAIMQVPELRQRYANRAASSDDPATCIASLEAQIAAAQNPTGFALAGDRRRLSSSVRTDSERLMLDLAANGIYEEIFDAWLDAPDTAAGIREQLNAG